MKRILAVVLVLAISLVMAFSGCGGTVGPQGPKGDTGLQGPAGTTCPAGPQGPKGDTGPQGPVGATGPVGPQGPQGSAGGTGEVISSVVANTLPAGQNGTASYDATTGMLTLGIPKGDTSLQGFAGTTGPAGPQGPKGDTGPQGSVGSTGPVGPQGPPGSGGATRMNASFNTLGTSTYLNTGPFNPTGGQPRWKDWANYSAAQSVTINTTVPGWVYISAFGNLQDGNNLVDMEIDLGISTSVVGPPDSGGTYWPRYNSNVLSAYSVSHFYHNTTSGTFTYYLLAAGSDATITPGSLVALFVPD